MTSDFSGGPGFAAFVVTFLLVVGVLVLFRSFNKQLRKVRTHPPEHERPTDAETEASPGGEDGDGAGDVVADEPGDRE
jgi:hypothetical protein